jgi:hypothetical protein
MTSRTPQHLSVTLDRVQRDGVRDAVDLLFISDMLARSESYGRERVISHLTHLSAVPELLEQLGWEKEGDRDSYVLELDDQIVGLMQEVGRMGSEELTDGYTAVRVCRAMTAEYWGDDAGERYFDLDTAKVDAAAVVAAAITGAVA